MIGEKLWQERWDRSSSATSSPAAGAPVANKEDALLAKKIKGICRGC